MARAILERAGEYYKDECIYKGIPSPGGVKVMGGRFSKDYQVPPHMELEGWFHVLKTVFENICYWSSTLLKQYFSKVLSMENKKVTTPE